MSTATYVNVLSAAVAAGKPRFSQPFAGDNGDYMLEQDYQTNLVLSGGIFTPLALNTPHPVYPNYYLVSEGALTDLGGGEVKWTRTYCQVPNTRNDSSSMNYEFIGYYGPLYQAGPFSYAGATGRNPFTDSVTCRMQNDYFMVNTSSPYILANGSSTAGPYATTAAITSIYGQKYYIPIGSFVSGAYVPTYLPTDPLQALTGSKIKVIYDSTLTVPPATGAFALSPPCVPTRATYNGWVVAGTEIVAEDSQLTRWKGNIYQRVTKYILPK